MAEHEPSERTLWCAFPDNLRRPISVTGIVGIDYIDTIKKKIYTFAPKCTDAYNNLDLYSPVRPINGAIIQDDLILLNPHQRISSEFPSSKDPELDIIIVVVQPSPGQGLSVAAEGDKSPTLAAQETICTREETVLVLAKMVDVENIIFVRGTPSSGKSTLSLLLRDHFRRNGRKVFLLGTWKQCLDDFDGAGHWTRFAMALRLKYQSVYATEDFFARDTVIIIDEAQGTYRDTTFWDNVVKDIRGGLGYKVKLCLFSSYGSPSAGTAYNPSDHRTPVDFAMRQCVSLTPLAAEGAPSIGLFYTRYEFDDVVTKLCRYSDPVLRYCIQRDARDYIFDLTNGHPGAVGSIVMYIFSVFRSETKFQVKSEITKHDVVQTLKNDDVVFKAIKGTLVSRSLPFQISLTSEAKDILCKILEEGFVPFDQPDETNTGLRLCYENGWIHRAVHEDESEQREFVAVLPSRLHEKYVEYLIGRAPATFPETTFPTIQSLCVKILSRFSAKRLRHCLLGKLSTAARLRPVEAQYQDEFYRAFNDVVGRGVPISSEWSRGGNGRVDFWIPETCWGIELLREHSNVDEHCDRFKVGGRYYPWVMNGMIKDYMVIDCATSLPRSDHPDPKLMRAIFSQDYSELTLFDHKNKIILNPIVLVGFGIGEVSSYRAFKHRWVGKPTTRPAWVIYGKGTNIGYASWNGATEVKTWLLEGSNSGEVAEDPISKEPLPEADITTVMVIPKVGFETVIPIPPDCPFPHLRVGAFDESGNRLGSSYFMIAKDDAIPTTHVIRPSTEVVEGDPEDKTRPDDNVQEETTKPEEDVQEEETKPEEDAQDEKTPPKEDAKEEDATGTGEDKIEFEQDKQDEEAASPTTGISASSVLLNLSGVICGLVLVVLGFRYFRRLRRRRGWFSRNNDNLEGGKVSGRGRSRLSNDGDLSGEDERLIRAHEFETPFDAEAEAKVSRADNTAG